MPYVVETKPVSGEDKYGGNDWHRYHTGYLPKYLAEGLSDKLKKSKKGILHVRVKQVKEQAD